MKAPTLLILLLSLTLPAIADTCNGHLRWGVPGQSDQILCRAGYALGYNYSRKSADWVAYRLTPAIHDSTNAPREDDFREDTEIPVIYRTTPADYVGSGYHQGHLANAASLDESVTMISETFLQSNMSPQIGGLNTGAWKALEHRERKWANSRKEVWVYAGAMFVGGVKDVIGNYVPVPTHYFKIVYDPTDQSAVAYIFPNERVLTADLPALKTSINTIEILTGLNFINRLGDSVEEAIETQRTTWPGE